MRRCEHYQQALERIARPGTGYLNWHVVAAREALDETRGDCPAQQLDHVRAVLHSDLEDRLKVTTLRIYLDAEMPEVQT